LYTSTLTTSTRPGEGVARAGDAVAATQPVTAAPAMPNTWWRRLRRRVRTWIAKAPPANDGWQPAGGPIVVIAPHPDDEVIGCGGTMRRHALAGDPVTVIYLTRGGNSRGYPWLSREARQKTRVAEAQASSAVLGVGETVFLNGIDGRCSEPSVADAVRGPLADAIAQRRPKVIFVPHADDNHPDHVAAYRLILGIARDADWKPEVLQYELWSPMQADFAIDVTAHMKAKLKAIKRHQLALDAFDYVPTMTGLAAYRSGTMLQRKGYAEAFKRTTLGIE
jgi:LmbE family N-acetylglucosaminyl deacetylase